jgi:intracellular sulfur oxidation DsrE/DsrF family protein
MPEDGMSIRELIARGVLFCVCERALTNTSKHIAQSKGYDAAAVKKEMMGGILPGIQPVPSGVWAIERAQQRGCAYCFAG